MEAQSRQMPASLLLTVSEAGILLAASEPIVRRLIAAGELPVVRIDSKMRLRRSDVEALIDRRLEAAEAT